MAKAGIPRAPQSGNSIDAGNLATEFGTHGPTEADGKSDVPDRHPEPDPDLPIPKHTARPSLLVDGKDDLDRGARSVVAVRHDASNPCTPANFSGFATRWMVWTAPSATSRRSAEIGLPCEVITTPGPPFTGAG
jgi:hypothetical protein